jgi:ribosomal protein S4
LLKQGQIVSLSQGRRLIQQEAVKLNGKTLLEMSGTVTVGDRVEVGKKLSFIVNSDGSQPPTT